MSSTTQRAAPQNLLEIEMLIQAHCLAQYKPRQSEAHDDALNRLLKADMLKLNPDLSVTTTLRGQFWVDHLATIPYPVESYKIPETQP
jgi:hypothetical protein